MADFVKVMKVGDLKPGELAQIEVNLNPVMLANVGGEYFAVSSTCPHEEAAMVEEGAEMDGKEVECPWHGSLFDVTTGDVLQGPSLSGLQKFLVRVEGDDILVGPA